MTFKLLSYVRHKEQEIEGLVISPSSQQSSHVTIYDPDCPNDNELEQIETPSTELISKCTEVIELFKEVI